MRLLPFFIFPAILGASALFAQTTPERYSEEYPQLAGGNAALYNGQVQRAMPGNIEGIYLGRYGGIQGADTYAPAELFYDGVMYSGIKVRLDLYRDELMVLASGNPANGTLLDPRRLGYADLHDQRVIYVGELGGYFVQLYDGGHGVLRKESYTTKETVTLERFSIEFSARPMRYYIGKDGVWHQVKRSKGSVLRVLDERRSELQRFIRQNRISVRSDTDGAIVKIVREYERLTR